MARRVLSEAATVRMALEATPGTAPSAGWMQLQPKPGGIALDPDLETVERDYLNVYAADEQGDIVGIKANAKITQDLTMDLLWQIRQMLLRSNPIEPGSVDQVFYRVTAVTDGGGSADGFTVAANGALPANTLVAVFGHVNSANNGLFKVTSGSGATSIKVPTATLVAETSPSNAILIVVGYEFASGDAQIDASNHLITTTKDLTELDIAKGSAVIIGDEAIGTRFATIPTTRKTIAYVKSDPAAHLLELEDRNYTVGGADVGGSKTIRLFFGSFLKNLPIGNTNYIEKTAHLELEDQNAATGNTVPAYTYGKGCALGQIVLTAPLKQPIVADLMFVGMDIPSPVLTASRVAGGGGGAGLSPASAYAPLLTSMLDTANDLEEWVVYDDSGNLSVEVNSAKLTINHNVKPFEIQGELGAIGHIFGKLRPMFDFELYFADYDQIVAARDNRRLKCRGFVANEQGGFAIRQTRTALRQPKKAYGANEPVMLATQMPGFRDANNVVMGITIFGYVPFGGE